MLVAFLSVKCLLTGGHVDHIRLDGDRIRLECSECHRKTTGWQVGELKSEKDGE